jgi:hypothetical protein
MNDFESSFPAIDTQNEVSTHFTPSQHKVKSVAILGTPNTCLLLDYRFETLPVSLADECYFCSTLALGAA